MLRRSIVRTQRLMTALKALTGATLLVFVCNGAAQDNAKPSSDQPAPVKPWVAPADARAVKNPVPVTPEGLAAAAKLFKGNCVMCHGEKGQGDGESAQTLNRKPANFTDKVMMSAETDGALFWKMSQGRAPMPSWEDVFSETQRWQLVNYLRQLTKNANSGK
jgi:mono/diheme cytochrome c family protein